MTTRRLSKRTWPSIPATLGPLINMRGEVVASTAKSTRVPGGLHGDLVRHSQWMRPSASAISCDAAGRVTRGRIGVQIGPVTKDVAESIGRVSRRVLWCPLLRPIRLLRRSALSRAT